MGTLNGGFESVSATCSGSSCLMKAWSRMTQARFSPMAWWVNTAHVVLSTPPETATSAFSLPTFFFVSASAVSTNFLGSNASIVALSGFCWRFAVL